MKTGIGSRGRAGLILYHINRAKRLKVVVAVVKGRFSLVGRDLQRRQALET